MSELNLEEPFEPGDVEIPSTLPVLPLKETVVFPQSMTPLAIGQERSITLVDEVASGERMLALVDDDLLLELAHRCPRSSPSTIMIRPAHGFRANGMTIVSWPRS